MLNRKGWFWWNKPKLCWDTTWWLGMSNQLSDCKLDKNWRSWLKKHSLWGGFLYGKPDSTETKVVQMTWNLVHTCSRRKKRKRHSRGAIWTRIGGVGWKTLAKGVVFYMGSQTCQKEKVVQMTLNWVHACFWMRRSRRHNCSEIRTRFGIVSAEKNTFRL